MPSTRYENVSSESEQLVLVDENDNEIGTISKADAHDANGTLHRAFSLFIFNGSGELLLQQRSPEKRLWGGYWSNSCCSHPRAGEDMDEAVHRRLEQELGMSADLEFVYKFAYHARYDDEGSENEFCWVYLGRTADRVIPNETEIAATRSLAADELDAELARRPDQFTPWFKLEWQRLREEHAETLRKYSKPA